MEKERLTVIGHNQFKDQQKWVEISINGTAAFHKEVQVKSFQILGRCKLNAPVEAERFVNKGSCSVEGTLSCNDLINVGQGSFVTITGEQIHSSGSLQISHSLLCTTFQSKGFIQVKEQLVGERVLIEVSVPSNIHMIVGREEVVIRSARVTFLNVLSFMRRKMVTDKIKGKFIDIEHTDARCVFGESVKIGENCKVDEVVYSKKIDVHKSATIRKISNLMR